jgi:hypothetical protein
MLTKSVFAHEVYVLDSQTVQSGLNSTRTVDWSVLFQDKNLIFTLLTVVGFFLMYAGFHWFSGQGIYQKINAFLVSKKSLGSLVCRIFIGLALIWGSLTGGLFGPEMMATKMPIDQLAQWALFGTGVGLIVGWKTKIFGILGVVVWGLLFLTRGIYLFSYLTFLGYFLSLLSSENQREKILRIGLGLAIVYTAVVVKILHPELTYTVFNQYNLARFFPTGVDYTVAMAGLVELGLGLCLFFNFATRLTILIFATIMTLALLVFGETVWPHLVLYGLAIALIF